MDRAEIRLELLKVLLPVASRVGLAGGETITRAHDLEMYVVNGKEKPREEKADLFDNRPVKKPLAQDKKPVHTTGRKKRK